MSEILTPINEPLPTSLGEVAVFGVSQAYVNDQLPIRSTGSLTDCS